MTRLNSSIADAIVSIISVTKDKVLLLRRKTLDPPFLSGKTLKNIIFTNPVRVLSELFSKMFSGGAKSKFR
jgi:hypothetical protein